MAADEIFVLVLVAVCACALLAMAVNSRRQKPDEGGASPAELLSESPVPDAAPATEPRRKRRKP